MSAKFSRVVFRSVCRHSPQADPDATRARAVPAAGTLKSDKKRFCIMAKKEFQAESKKLIV
jgi:hypothetical protein